MSIVVAEVVGHTGANEHTVFSVRVTVVSHTGIERASGHTVETDRVCKASAVSGNNTFMIGFMCICPITAASRGSCALSSDVVSPAIVTSLHTYSDIGGCTCCSGVLGVPSIRALKHAGSISTLIPIVRRWALIHT